MGLPSALYNIAVLQIRQGENLTEATQLVREVSRLPDVEQDLRAGRLVRPFGVALPVESAYYMVFPKHRAGDVRIATFVDWVRSEGVATAGST